MANPRQIGGYEVSHRVGTHALGETYSGRDERGDAVTLQRLDRGALAGRLDAEAFARTIRDLREIRVPGLLPILGMGLKNEDVVVVIRNTDGPTMADLLERGPMLAARVAHLARQAAECLEALLAIGLPHGDVRPATVHLGDEGRAFLGPPAFLPLTVDEQEAPYLAPEVLEGGAGDASADLFSLGVIIYQAVTGQLPFPGRTGAEVLSSIRRGVLADPETLADEIPEGLPALLLEMLDENPVMRPSAVASRLRAIEEGRPDDVLEIGAVVDAADPPLKDVPVVTPEPSAPSAPASPLRTTEPARPAVAPRGRVGRLLLPRAGGDPLLYDLLDERVHVAAGDGSSVLVGTEAVDDAACIVVRGALRDLLTACPDAEERARVNGSLFDDHELRDGDVITVAGNELRYTLEPPVSRPPTRSLAAPARAESRRSERLFLLVSLLISAAVIVGLWVAYGNIRRRGQDVLEEAGQARRDAAGQTALPSTRTGDEEKASAALQEALGLARDHPTNFGERERLLEVVVERFPNTKAAARAGSELVNLGRQVADAEIDELNAAIGRADELVDEGRLYDASQVFREYATRWARTSSAARAERNAARIDRKIRDRYEVDEETIEALEESGDVADALDRLRNVLVYASPEVRGKVEQRIEALHRRIDETLSDPQGSPEPEEPTPPAREPGAENGPPDRPTPGKEPVKPRDPAVVAAEEAEARAGKIIESAWTDARRGAWGRTRELVRLLLGTLAGTKAVDEDRERLEALQRLAILEVEGPGGLLAGRVESLKKGRLRITYDFSAPGQVKDWTYLKPFAVLEAGTFKVVRGQALLRARGTGAFLHALVMEGDMTIGFRLRSERPHDIGPAFFDPDNEMRHILFSISNTFFTLSVRRDPLPGHVILLFGRGAWADTPTGELGFVRVAQDEDPPVAAGTWTYVGAGRAKKQLVFSLGNKKLTGRTTGDDKRGYGDLRPALFVLKSRAEFTDVTIEGRPSRAWLAEEKQSLRRALGL